MKIAHMCFLFSFSRAYYLKSSFRDAIFRNRCKIDRSSSRSIESLKESLSAPSDKICEAIERSGYRLTVSDASTLSGFDFSRARNELMAATTLSDGVLDVSSTGEIIYSFPANFRSLLLQRSAAVKAKAMYKVIYPYLSSATRMGFGFILIASLMTIAVTFSVVSASASSSSSSSRDERDSDKRQSSRYSYSSNNGLLFAIDLNDLFFRRQYYSYYSNDSKPSMNLLESIFSYVFGDGDPNHDFETEQLQAVAKVIRLNKGYVIAEQLAPYLDPPEVTSKLVSESFILPASISFQGAPMVTEDGNIVYAFPDILTRANTVYDVDDDQPQTQSGSVADNTNPSQAAAAYIEEAELPFSLASSSQLLTASTLGIANLAGVVWLGRILRNPLFIARYPVFASSVSAPTYRMLGIAPKTTCGMLATRLHHCIVFPLFAVYAAFYNIAPAVRFVKNRTANIAIKLRNKRRKLWAARLNDPDLKEKKAEAQAIASRPIASFSTAAVLTNDDLLKTKLKIQDAASTDDNILYRSDQSSQQKAATDVTQLLEEFDRKMNYNENRNA